VKLNVTFLVFLNLAVSAQTVPRQQLREYFLTALDHEYCRDSITCALENIKNKTPCEESYTGICYAFRILSTESLLSKLKFLSRSRTYLNDGVARAPADPEAHFLRFVLEHYIPSWLGLSKHLNEDLQVVFSNLHFIDDSPKVKKRVFEFIIESKRATPAQNLLLKDEIAKIKL
jgi:hypothetical protein